MVSEDRSSGNVHLRAGPSLSHRYAFASAVTPSSLISMREDSLAYQAADSGECTFDGHALSVDQVEVADQQRRPSCHALDQRAKPLVTGYNANNLASDCGREEGWKRAQVCLARLSHAHQHVELVCCERTGACMWYAQVHV